ncbi:hypothetical protein ABIA32_000291 [Streptacidiphilus sp. MAP12-20]
MAKLTEEQRLQRAAKRALRAALDAEAEDQRKRERRDLWQREGMCLSWEEYVAGEPCRGCGEPVSDGLGNWWPTLKLSEPERLEYEEAQRAFRERHSECNSAQWGIDGSRVAHCCFCCPPPPIGPRQLERLSALAASWPSAEERKKDLDTWDMTLRCNHVVPFIQHREHTYVSTRVLDCPECGERRGVLSSERIGPAYNEDGLERERAAAEHERLKSELALAEAKLTRQQKSAGAAQSRIDELRRQLSGGP